MRRSLFSWGVFRFPKQTHRPPIAPGAIRCRAISLNTPGGQQNVQADESRPSHETDNAYPAQPGDRVGEKFRLLSRLGRGTDSTIWLTAKLSTRALRGHRYVTLRIGDSSTSLATAEQRLQEFNRLHGAWLSASRQTYINKAINSFGVKGPKGIHPCTVFEHVHKPHWIIGRHVSDYGLTHSRIQKGLIPSVIRCLDFLHTTCHAVHTDPRGHQFMLPIDDTDVVRAVARKIRSKRLGHSGKISRRYISLVREDVKLTTLREFEPMVAKDLPYAHDENVHSGAYVPPEVLLKTELSYPADIWNLGLLLWKMVSGNHLLDGRLPGDTELSDVTLFAQMVRLLGPPPPELLEAADSEVLARFFDAQGTFKYPELIPGEEWDFSSKMTMLEGQDKYAFINFIKRMLAWAPNERSTARELLDDPWLKL